MSSNDGKVKTSIRISREAHEHGSGLRAEGKFSAWVDGLLKLYGRSGGDYDALKLSVQIMEWREELAELLGHIETETEGKTSATSVEKTVSGSGGADEPDERDRPPNPNRGGAELREWTRRIVRGMLEKPGAPDWDVVYETNIVKHERGLPRSEFDAIVGEEVRRLEEGEDP